MQGSSSIIGAGAPPPLNLKSKDENPVTAGQAVRGVCVLATLEGFVIGDIQDFKEGFFIVKQPRMVQIVGQGQIRFIGNMPFPHELHTEQLGHIAQAATIYPPYAAVKQLEDAYRQAMTGLVMAKPAV